MPDSSTRNLLALPLSTDGGNTFYVGLHTTIERIDLAISRCNWTATTDPTTTDDISPADVATYGPYSVGSLWLNTATHQLWACEDNTDGAASWLPLYAANRPVRITHDGGASQAILTTPALCEIEAVVTKCVQASSTATVSIGYAADPDALMADAEVPKTLNSSQFNRFPLAGGITSATDIIATVGGEDSVGEWDVWLKISRYA